eukprot:TRINITY_DN27487_c0_g1_i1.p1 TRINITY_DN27487_c0_g1~~TRINITY_DN27487_c0_g1_i1.p1  ORF type:complete len:386 (-),score=94.28 TRINITY_DN27487_c0_g1_i1:277-1434(-)
MAVVGQLKNVVPRKPKKKVITKWDWLNKYSEDQAGGQVTFASEANEAIKAEAGIEVVDPPVFRMDAEDSSAQFSPRSSLPDLVDCADPDPLLFIPPPIEEEAAPAKNWFSRAAVALVRGIDSVAVSLDRAMTGEEPEPELPQPPPYQQSANATSSQAQVPAFRAAREGDDNDEQSSPFAIGAGVAESKAHAFHAAGANQNTNGGNGSWLIGNVPLPEKKKAEDESAARQAAAKAAVVALEAEAAEFAALQAAADEALQRDRDRKAAAAAEPFRLLEGEGLPVYARLGDAWLPRLLVKTYGSYFYLVEQSPTRPAVDRIGDSPCFGICEISKLVRRTTPAMHLLTIDFEEAGALLFRFSYPYHLDSFINVLTKESRIPVLEDQRPP